MLWEKGLMEKWKEDFGSDIKKLFGNYKLDKMMEIFTDEKKLIDTMDSLLKLGDKHLPEDHWEAKMWPLKKALWEETKRKNLG